MTSSHGRVALRITCPTSLSPAFVKATTEGVVRAPSALVTIVGFPPSMAATAELVVPRSTPTTCKRQFALNLELAYKKLTCA